jgi:hypothetical protein
MRVEMVGQVFGRLTVSAFAGQNAHRFAMWECVCECGNTTTVMGSSLRRGLTQSCGCLNREINIANPNRRTHGHAGGANSVRTRTYRIWANMRSRCSNPKAKQYKDYGGRGIKVAEHWKKFDNFLADMGECPDGYQIDRYPDGDGNYEPGNARWATPKENCAPGRRRPGRWPDKEAA